MGFLGGPRDVFASYTSSSVNPDDPSDNGDAFIEDQAMHLMSWIASSGASSFPCLYPCRDTT